MFQFNRKERTMAIAIGINLFVILLKFGLARASGSMLTPVLPGTL